MKHLLQESFGRNLTIMRYLGMFPSNLFLKFYGYSLYTVVVWIFPLLVVAAVISVEDVNIIRLSENWFFLPEMWILIVKILPFLNKKEDISEILIRIESRISEPRIRKHREIVEKCSRECRKLFTFFICSSVLAVLLWAGKPFYMEGNTLPIEIFLPYVLTKDHVTYYPLFLYVVSCTLYGATSNSSIDCLVSGLIHHLSGQIRILKDNLINVGLRADHLITHSVSFEEKENQRDLIISKHLKECIDHYNNIIRCKEDLEKMFSSVPFVHLVVGAIVICISCFQLIILDPNSANFFAMVEFIMTMICQIYMYCHYGNELHQESSSIATAAYMSDWYTFDPESKRMLIILMERAKKPLVLKAGNLLPLSMATFVSIIRKAYSLLAVLKKWMG